MWYRTVSGHLRIPANWKMAFLEPLAPEQEGGPWAGQYVVKLSLTWRDDAEGVTSGEAR